MAEIIDLNEERWRRRASKPDKIDKPTDEVEVFDYTIDPESRQRNIDYHPASFGKRVLSLVDSSYEIEQQQTTFESILYEGLKTVLADGKSGQSNREINRLITGDHRGDSLAKSIEKHKSNPVILDKITTYGVMYTDTLNALLRNEDSSKETQKQIRSLAYVRAGLESHAGFWIEQLYDKSLGYNRGPLPAVRADRSSWLKQMRADESTFKKETPPDERTANISSTIEKMLGNNHEDLYARYVQPYRYIGRLTTDAFLTITKQYDEKLPDVVFGSNDEEIQEEIIKNNRGRFKDMSHSYKTNRSDVCGRPVSFEELFRSSGYAFPYQADHDFIDYENQLLERLS